MRRLPGPHQTVKNIWEDVKDFIREELTEHRKNWDPSDPRDYIDCYLNEIQTVTRIRFISLRMLCLSCYYGTYCAFMCSTKNGKTLTKNKLLTLKLFLLGVK